MAILIKKSKIFNKSKVDGLKKLPYVNHKISLGYELYFEHFLAFLNHFMMLVYTEVHSKGYFLMRIKSKF